MIEDHDTSTNRAVIDDVLITGVHFVDVCNQTREAFSATKVVGLRCW